MKALILILFIGIPFYYTEAQFTVETNFGTMVDDNIDNNYLQTYDRIYFCSIKTGYGWSTEQTETGLFYTGALNYYSLTVDRTFQIHQLSFDYEQIFGEEDESTFNASAGFSTRLDRGDYTIYDHQIYNSSLQLQHYFTETLMGKGIYSLHYVKFSELSSFDYTEHTLSTQGSVYFNTKTTLIAFANIGMKIYSTPNYDSTTTTVAWDVDANNLTNHHQVLHNLQVWCGQVNQFLRTQVYQ